MMQWPLGPGTCEPWHAGVGQITGTGPDDGRSSLATRRQDLPIHRSSSHYCVFEVNIEFWLMGTCRPTFSVGAPHPEGIDVELERRGPLSREQKRGNSKATCTM